MKNVCRTAAWVTLLALGLAVGQPTTVPPAPPAAKPGGVSTRTLAPQAMKLSANGQYVRVYPKDALKPFDSTDWYAERPLTVTKAEYDKNTQELLVAVEYGWANIDEDRFRATIVEKFREAGRPVDPKAISVIPLEWAAFSLVIRDGNAEYVAYATKKVSNVAAQTLAFRVPMQTGADTLHQRLANPNTMPSVQLVLRAGYAFDKIGGLTVERKAISAAWQRVMESVFPNDPIKQAGPLYLDRDAEQVVYAKLKAEASTTIRSYGLNAADEADALKTVLAQLDKLTTPAAPMTVAELLDLNERSVVVTATAGKIEAKPATDQKAITEFQEHKSSLEKVASIAESISDIASNSSIDDRQFHSQARRLVVDGSAKVGYAIWSGSANMHLDKSENEMTDNHYKEMKAARAYAMNKSAYSRDVQQSHSLAWKGLRKEDSSIAKLLNLKRMSAAGLSSVGSANSDFTRLVGTEVVTTDTAVPLVATPLVPDAVVAMEERVRAMEKRLIAAEAAASDLSTRLGKAESNIAGLGTTVDKVNKWVVWEKLFGGPSEVMKLRKPDGEWWYVK